MSKLKGIDISNWQGTPDFSKVKQNWDFVIQKATEGVGYIDKSYERNRKKMREAGLLSGFYHFARADLGNTPEAEADFFLKVLDSAEGELLVLDFEVSYTDQVGWCKRWLDYVSQNLGGYKPLIYLNQSQNKNYDWSPVVKGSYGLWLAVYDYNPEGGVPKTDWPFVTMKQYSNKEQVSGISGNVDGNVFYGDRDTWRKYCVGGSVANPEPTDEILEAKLDSAIAENIKLQEDIRRLEESYRFLEKKYTEEGQRDDEHIKNLQDTISEQSLQISTNDKRISELTSEKKSLTEAYNAKSAELLAVATSLEKIEPKYEKLKLQNTKDLYSFKWIKRFLSIFRFR